MRASLILLSVLCILGCDRGPVAVTAAPATQATPTTAPAIALAATLPTSVTFWIDQQRYEFPPVLMELEARGDALAAELMTDNPPDVEEDTYKGNSLFLPLIIETPAEGEALDGAKWEFRAPNIERAETIVGINLHGHRKVLQPFDVVVTISGSAPVVQVEVRGVFLMFDDEDPAAPPRKANVMAELVAPARWRGRKPDSRATQS